MIRLSRLADYSIVILTAMSGQGEPIFSAQVLAEKTNISLPTVSKILKLLSKAGLLMSTRGSRGGYQLARPAQNITITEIIEAMDGPIALTDCVTHQEGESCAIQSCCPTQPAWVQINQAVRQCLSDLTLADITNPLQFLPPQPQFEVTNNS